MPRVTYGDRLHNLLDRPLNDYDRGVVESLLNVYERKRALSAGRKRYLETLEERYSEERLAALQENPLVDRLSLLQERITDKGSWDAGFCESLHDQVTRGRDLSPRQLEILEKIAQRYSDEAIAEAAGWEDTYRADPLLQEKAKVVAAYYDKAGYFTDLAHRILNMPEFVPSKKQFDKMTGNKFAQKIWDAWVKDPDFPQGSYVYLRSTAAGQLHALTAGKPCIVIAVNAVAPKSAAKGGKVYQVLPFGGAKAFFVEERSLKAARRLG